MTSEPNLDWLADEHGNLRADVAQDLQRLPIADVVAPRAAVPPLPPTEVRRVQRPIPVPTAAPQRLPLAVVRSESCGGHSALLWVAIALAGVMLGFVLGKQKPTTDTLPKSFVVSGLTREPRPAPTAPPSQERRVVIKGSCVNVRSGPGLSYATIGAFPTEDSLDVGVERSGWYEVRSQSGLTGWVYGAYLYGVGAPDRGPAYMRETVTSIDLNPPVTVDAGERVFIVECADGKPDIVLPTGLRLQVPPEAIARAD